MIQFITLLCIAFLVIVDQVIKLFVLKYLEPIGSMPVINKVLQLAYVENTGAAFGSFSKYTLVLSIFTALILICLIAYLMSKKLKFGIMYISITMIVSGGLGNLIDRIFRGFVIDYIEPLFVNFAVFNFADILVSVGAVILIAYLIYDAIVSSKSQKEKTVQDNE